VFVYQPVKRVWNFTGTLKAFAFISALALSQPRFEVASIRPNPNQGRMTAEFPPGNQRFIATYASIRQLIVIAYGITPHQLSEVVPVSEDKYDVQARADWPSSRPEMQQMLQSLLIERFHLSLRREQRDAPIYALIVEKRGLKLKPTNEESPWTLSRIRGDEQASGRVVFKSESMADFAFALSTFSTVGRMVVDETGLTGKYDFELEPGPPAGPADAPIFTALRRQLGLRLEPRRAKVEFLVIEHVEAPTGN
jgi:uncharacterized protein (TIGR03435 family)